MFTGLKGGLLAGEPVFLDVPECNAAAAAVALATRHGMESLFDTARMDTGSVPDLRMERISGVKTFELGWTSLSRDCVISSAPEFWKSPTVSKQLAYPSSPRGGFPHPPSHIPP